MLKDIFGFAEHHEKSTNSLGYKITKTRKSDTAVLNKDNATNIGKSKIIAIDWFVRYYTPSVSQQAILSKKIISKTPTELQIVQRSVFMKEVNAQCLEI